MSVVMRPVQSSNVSAVGYDPVKRQLFIEFKSGLYRYDAVPPNVYADLRQAESVGKFVAKIRFLFPYTKIDQLPPPDPAPSPVIELRVRVYDTVEVWERARRDDASG